MYQLLRRKKSLTSFHPARERLYSFFSSRDTFSNFISQGFAIISALQPHIQNPRDSHFCSSFIPMSPQTVIDLTSSFHHLPPLIPTPPTTSYIDTIPSLYLLASIPLSYCIMSTFRNDFRITSRLQHQSRVHKRLPALAISWCRWDVVALEGWDAILKAIVV
jgi:hypothetical protein